MRVLAAPVKSASIRMASSLAGLFLSRYRQSKEVANYSNENNERVAAGRTGQNPSMGGYGQVAICDDFYRTSLAKIVFPLSFEIP